MSCYLLKYTILKPLADRVLVKVNSFEEKTTGGILLPTTSQSRPQGGEVVVVGKGMIIGDNKVDVNIQVYSLRTCNILAICF
jgi:chaperonin GroES